MVFAKSLCLGHFYIIPPITVSLKSEVFYTFYKICDFHLLCIDKDLGMVYNKNDPRNITKMARSLFGHWQNAAF